MRDPHVEVLTYRIVTTEGFHFASPPAKEFQTPEFDVRLANGTATFTMKKHFATEAEAREAVGGLIRQWELDIALDKRRECVRFEFDSAKVIDRMPPETSGSAHVLAVSGGIQTQGALTISLQVAQSWYPDPPTDFAVNIDVEGLWRRYDMYVHGRDQLATVTFLCLSVLQTRTTRGTKDRRAKTARRYVVDKDVLDKLAELSSDVGDMDTRRKVDERSVIRPLTAKEAEWLDVAVRRLIRRIGEFENAQQTGAQLQQITMADLPKL